MDKPSTLQKQYFMRFESVSDYRNSLWQLLCRDFFQRLVTEEANLLELGCGWGEFSNNINAGRKYAMDLNPDAALKLNHGVEVLVQDCSEPWPIADASLDVIFTSNFLEHLPNKSAVESTLRHVWRCLKPGGQIICMGPNGRLLPGTYWDFWDHHVMITDRSLAELLKLSGFTVTKQLSRFLPYSLSRKWNPPLWMVRYYLRMPVVWRILGKQFLLIGEKRLAS